MQCSGWSVVMQQCNRSCVTDHWVATEWGHTNTIKILYHHFVYAQYGQ